MTETNNLRLQAIVKYATEHTSEKKAEALEEWARKLEYAMEHMDEAEYGGEFLYNMEYFCEMHKGGYKDISDRVVTNTVYVLCAVLNDLTGGKRNKLRGILNVDEKETLLPGSTWVYRGYRAYVRRNNHSFSVQYVTEKNGDQQDEESIVTKIRNAMAG